MAYEYKLPKITLDDAKAMTARERNKTLAFERRWFSRDKGWPADEERKKKWHILGSPTSEDVSVEDIVGLRPGVRTYLKRYSNAAGTGLSAVRTRKAMSRHGGKTRRHRKSRRHARR